MTTALDVVRAVIGARIELVMMDVFRQKLAEHKGFMEGLDVARSIYAPEPFWWTQAPEYLGGVAFRGVMASPICATCGAAGAHVSGGSRGSGRW